MRYIWILTMTFAAILALRTKGDEPDPIKEKLNLAKTAFSATMEKAKTELLDELQKREDAARAEANKKVVDIVKMEREEFINSGQLPKIVPSVTYKRDWTQARQTLETAMASTVKEYTKAGRDAEADKLAAELKEFKKTGLLAGAGRTDRFLQFAKRGFVELQKTQGLIDVDGSFTVEAWLRWSGKNQNYQAFVNDAAWPGGVVDFPVTKPSGWLFRATEISGTDKRGLEFKIAYTVQSNKYDWLSVTSPPQKVIEGQWQHLAVCKTPATIRIFWNGKLAVEKICRGIKFNGCPSDLYLGPRKGSGDDQQFEGDFRAFRISNKALYIKPFVPQQVFSKDSSTELLLDFDGDDSEKIADVSGKDRFGMLKDVHWGPVPKK